MPIRMTNLTLTVDDAESRLAAKAAAELRVPPAAVTHLRVLRRAVDARGRAPHFVFTVEATLSAPEAEAEAVRQKRADAVEPIEPVRVTPGGEELRGRVVVVGGGPAGLFAALLLAQYGYRPLLLERGAPVEQRHADTGRFLTDRTLDPDSNFLFGAGGAGTYSDGKLHSHLRDPRVRMVLDSLVEAGAPPEILVDAKPHVGTDRLHGVVELLCQKIQALGGELRWRTKLTGLDAADGRLRAVETSGGRIETNALILATGANARDTFAGLLANGLAMEPKPFQMGLRIEHPRELIDGAIYGKSAGHPRLGAADYVLAANPVAAFCVCPGGVLVASCCEAETVCTNGMSGHARNTEFTNAALVTTVRPEAFGPGALAGLDFQRRWEREAFQLGGGDYTAPAQSVPDFLGGSLRHRTPRTSYPLGVRPVRLARVLPAEVAAAIAAALPEFGRRLRGFAGEAAVLVGPETRASCPVRIVRDPERRVSMSVDGVYPAGEGSGYASGIMTSAVDGLKAAEALAARFAPVSW